MTAPSNNAASMLSARGLRVTSGWAQSYRPATLVLLSTTTFIGCRGEQARARLCLETRPTEELIKPITRDGNQGTPVGLR